MVRHFIFDANFILVNEKLNLFDFEVTTFPEGVMEYLQVVYLANDFFFNNRKVNICTQRNKEGNIRENQLNAVKEKLLGDLTQ